MRHIELVNGGTAVVDDDDYAALCALEWFRSPKGYALTRLPGQLISMQRYLLKPGPGQHIDHADRDKLNNRRANLRLCNRSQNSANRPAFRTRAGKYKGVQKRSDRINPFRARIKVDGRLQSLGYYATAESAARAYDEAARSAFGEFAALNFPVAR